ncbi:hybrid sensor histidine kinase/response regulator [Dinghuibacter silviterrae]|uniref:histidine kinase n=1 Tax=Dinghuibacter silviterrae TaxID=1539049 RepID=A0A4R8DNV6_9BACT|nr:hybrid sensor histidine kinase/response regulator [Dinghuibacter silviterrae]TDW99498.1 PAS domain S-box-containing protein [Dinghuibacter silviterrae]
MTRSHLHPKKILIIDDDEDDFFITSDYIKDIPGQSFVLDWCPQYETGLARILERAYDIYLIDYRLGAHTGLDLIRSAIAHRCDDPLILLTGKGNQKIDMEAMQVGATDYLVKTELNTEKLERCIRYALERAESMRALRHNERKYRSIFERSKDAVFLSDKDLRIKDVNEGMIALLGYSREELSARMLPDLIEDKQDQAHLEGRLKRWGEINDWEIVLAGKHGQKLSCILSASMEHDEIEGDYFQGIIHDITALKKAEKITLQAEKLAAAGRLVRTLAHEVRNPLNNINLSTEQLQHDLKDPEQALYLDIIRRNSHRIEALISELLDSSRPTEMALGRNDLRELLEQALDIAVDRINLKRVRLRKVFPETPLFLDADAGKLKIALLNIIINAVEAVEPGQGELIIGLLQDPEHYIVQITDNGCGISQEHLSRLFEPYFTSKRNGMGLGLAATLNIVQAHRGSIDVRSEEQRGTTFTLFFPRP